MTATEKAATFMLEANQFFTAVELARRKAEVLRDELELAKELDYL